MSAPSSLAARDALEIRSFRLVFALERRLFKFDRWRLPLPYGLPVRGIAYAAVALAAAVLAGGLPGLGQLAEAVPAPLRFVVGPVALAAVAARLRVDGRPAHRFALAWCRHRLGPRWLDAFAAIPAPGSTHAIAAPIVLADDAAAPDYRPAVIAGPARVLLALPAHAQARGRTLEVSGTGGSPLRQAKVVALAAGQRLEVR